MIGLPSGANTMPPLMTRLIPPSARHGIALHRDLERAPDPVDVVGQQLVREILRRAIDRPVLAAMLVGADQQALALLPQIGFAVEVDAHRDFALERGDRRDVVGDDILMLHRHDRQLDPRHAPDLARPQAAGIDDIVGLDGAVPGHHQPAALRRLLQLDHRIAQIDLRAARLGRLGIGVGHAGGIDMPVVGIVQRADELGGVDQRIELLHLAPSRRIRDRASGAARGCAPSGNSPCRSRWRRDRGSRHGGCRRPGPNSFSSSS